MIYVDAFFDESMPGQDGQDRSVPQFVVVAGLVNLSREWLSFCVEWGNVLDKPRAIKYFHSVEANGRRGEFEGFSRNQRDDKVINLIDVIRRYRPAALVSAVYPADYHALLEEMPGVMPDDPYISCLHHLMIEAVELNRNRKIDEPLKISLTFEDNGAMRKKAVSAYNLVIADNPEYASVLGESLAFVDKKAFKPVQAADALAYDLNKDFSGRLRDPSHKSRKSLTAILENVRRYGLYWPWDEINLRRLFQARFQRLCGGEIPGC